MTVKQRLIQLGVAADEPSGPFGAYVPAKRVGDTIYVSGQLPIKGGELVATGVVGDGVDVEAARRCARQCVVNALAAVAVVPGGVNQLAGVASVTVFVASAAGFTEQSKVADAASELLHEVFGDEAGQHVRAAVGVAALPKGAPVEVSVVFAASPEADPGKFVLDAENDAPNPASLGPDKPEMIPK